MTKLNRRSFAFVPLADENQTSLKGPALDGFVDDVIYQVALQIAAKRRVQADTANRVPLFSSLPKQQCAKAPGQEPTTVHILWEDELTQAEQTLQ